MRLLTTLFAACLAAWLSFSPGIGAAHPHVFVEAAARFIFDARDRLTAVWIEHRYDPLMSLLTMSELELDPFGSLSRGGAARFTLAQAPMLEEAGGFAALSIGAREIALGAPQGLEASLRDDRLAVAFMLPLRTPTALDGDAATLAVFDPEYFVAFEFGGAVTVEGGEGCAAAPVPWRSTPALVALQARLSNHTAGATPGGPDVGRLFAAEALATCG